MAGIARNEKDPLLSSELLFVALLGGVIGAVTAFIAFDGMTTSTMNFQTFSEVAFAFGLRHFC